MDKIQLDANNFRLSSHEEFTKIVNFEIKVRNTYKLTRK